MKNSKRYISTFTKPSTHPATYLFDHLVKSCHLTDKINTLHKKSPLTQDL